MNCIIVFFQNLGGFDRKVDGSVGVYCRSGIEIGYITYTQRRIILSEICIVIEATRVGIAVVGVLRSCLLSVVSEVVKYMSLLRSNQSGACSNLSRQRLGSTPQHKKCIPTDSHTHLRQLQNSSRSQADCHREEKKPCVSRQRSFLPWFLLWFLPWFLPKPATPAAESSNHLIRNRLLPHLLPLQSLSLFLIKDS